jgi:DNA-binding transcriptional ArsR family regulator
MGSGPDEESLVDDWMSAVLTDTVRVMIFSMLFKHPASAAEIASRLDLPVDKVRYHLRRLREAGAIEAVRDEPRRGVVQRYFAFKRPFFLSDEDYAGLTLKQKRALNAGLLRLGFTEAARALVARASDRSDDCLARTEIEVSEEGWKELTAIHREAIAKVMELEARESKRPKDAGGRSFRATSLLICFEHDLGPAADPS